MTIRRVSIDSVSFDAMLSRAGALWDAGHDTEFIAARLDVHETIAVRLAAQYRVARDSRSGASEAQDGRVPSHGDLRVPGDGPRPFGGGARC